MARKNINYETPAKKATPAKKPPKRSYWDSDSPLKRVTKDLFGGVQRSRLNNQKSSLIFARTLNTKNYSLTGSKKRLEIPNIVQYVKGGLYTKSMQVKELKKPTANEGISASEMALWKKLGNDYYRDAAAKAKAKYKAKAIYCCQKQ